MVQDQKISLPKQPAFIEILRRTKKKNSNVENILLEQYKIFLGQDEKIRDQRQQKNMFFLTANSLIMSILGTFINQNAFESIHLLLILFLLFLGIGCSVAWLKTLSSFQVLTNKSYQFIKSIEEHLGTPVFTEFYEHLHPAETSHPSKTFLTGREKIIPYLFLSGYCVYVIIDVIKFLHKVDFL